MDHIGLYTQLTEFTTEHAGTAEWCKAERGGEQFFVKKFQSPVYPSKDIGLPEKMYNAGVAEFKETLATKQRIYQRLRECDQSRVLVVPIEVINYQFHICTIADYVVGNVSPEEIPSLSEWQRLVLMRTLTLALMNVHKAGVVHSDMKPDNVLITQDKNGHCILRLIDFDGSFFESNPPTDPEEVVGDPTFFAPEAYRQSMDEDVCLDHRIDIFALGIIFHYFWCGKFPQKPADQTIGECLLRGGVVTIDDSIPLVIKQLIQKMIATEPSNRIELKTVYDVLGVQIERYPAKIINLQKTRNNTKLAEVKVNYCGENGEILMYRTLKVPFGTKRTIEAENIDGYHLDPTELRSKEILVDSKGHTVAPVIFTYQKNSAVTPDPDPDPAPKKWKKLVLIILSIVLIYWFIMYVLSMSAHNEGRYADAKKYMDMTPLFSSLFSSTYDENEKKLNQGEMTDFSGENVVTPTAKATRKATVTSMPQSLQTNTPKPVSYGFDFDNAKFDIRPGESSSRVSEIQSKLVSLGYLSNSNHTSYDTETKNAMVAFQKNNGIHGRSGQVNGAATELTQAVLFSSIAIPEGNPSRLNTNTITSTPFAVKNGAYISGSGNEKTLHFRLTNSSHEHAITAMVMRYWLLDNNYEVNDSYAVWQTSWNRLDLPPDSTQMITANLHSSNELNKAEYLFWSITEVALSNGEVYIEDMSVSQDWTKTSGYQTKLSSGGSNSTSEINATKISPPTPKPSPTPRRTATPKPTQRPTQKPTQTPKPTVKPTSTPNYPVLSRGDNNDYVRELQVELVERNFLYDVADGNFGAKTEAAVKLVQEKAGLPVTGIADNATQMALRKSKIDFSSQSGSSLILYNSEYDFDTGKLTVYLKNIGSSTITGFNYVVRECNASKGHIGDFCGHSDSWWTISSSDDFFLEPGEVKSSYDYWYDGFSFVDSSGKENTVRFTNRTKYARLNLSQYTTSDGKKHSSSTNAIYCIVH